MWSERTRGHLRSRQVICARIGWQRPQNHCRWNAQAVRNSVRGYVLGNPAAPHGSRSPTNRISEEEQGSPPGQGVLGLRLKHGAFKETFEAPRKKAGLDHYRVPKDCASSSSHITLPQPAAVFPAITSDQERERQTATECQATGEIRTLPMPLFCAEIRHPSTLRLAGSTVVRRVRTR